MAERPFVVFGPSHIGALALFAVVAVALIIVGRRQRGGSAANLTRRTFAVVFALFFVGAHVYFLLPPRWGIGHSLPLQLSDIAAIAAIWALWSRSPTTFALTYYWALTLDIQSLITADLHTADFPSPEFLQYFGQHSLVVWAGIYLTFGVGMRPNWRSYVTAVAVTITWGIAMIGFNAIAGTNYGYVNRKPQVGSMLDYLGPWPWYLLSELVIGAAVWALITWPWVLRRPAPPAS